MKKGFRNLLAITTFILMTGTLLTGCGVNYVISGSTKTLNKDDAQEFKVEKAVVEPITSIEIKTSVAEVELIEADEYSVEIDYLYWNEEPNYSLKDGKLNFDDSNAFPNSYSINFNLHNTIKIYLPKGSSLTNLSIANSSGDVQLAGFTAEDLEVSVSYGDFSMKDAAAAKADISLSSGTSKISDFETGQFDFTNSYGNATFTNLNTADALLSSDIVRESLTITMSSGDVKINGLKTKDVEITNSYGDVTCEDVTAEEFDSKLSSGNLEVSHADLKDVDVSNSYGDVTLKLSGAQADYSMDLNTSYGSIKVGDKSYEEHYTTENNGTRKVMADLSSGNVKIKFE